MQRLLGVLVLVWATSAQGGEFVGAWKVVEGPDVGQARTLVERGGQLVLAAPPRLSGARSRPLSGSSLGRRAELSAEPRRGATQILEERDAEGTTVRASLRLVGDGPSRRIQARFLRDGALVRRETWALARSARVEILEVTPQRGYDPKDDGPLQVRVAVRSPEAHRLRVRIELPDERGPRLEFYREVLGGAEPLTLSSTERGRVRAGEVVVELAGRDDTAARRILLGGSYRLVAELDEGADPLDRDEASVTFAAPRSEHLVPQWKPGTFADIHGQEVYAVPPDATQRQRDLSRDFGLIYSRTPSPETSLPLDEFARRLSLAAGVVIDTHGYEEGVFGYVAGDEEEHDGDRVQEIDSSRLNGALPEAFQGKSLKDVHFVVIYACSTGAGALPGTLIRRGVDLVVAFSQPVVTSVGPHYTRRLFADLSGQGDAAQPEDGVRSLGWAAREAAAFADERYWAEYLSKHAPKLEGAWRRRLRESIVIRTAPGIDATAERANPARYGNSTN
ncbi:MAG: hypothetical protein R3F62_08855 [Planctomycetota bacterium]